MAQSYLTIEKEQFLKFNDLDIQGAFSMYNLLKYKEKVLETGQTGEEAYKTYMKAAYPFFQRANAEVIFKGKPEFTLIGEVGENYWDEILIIKYNSKKDFLEMITDKDYPTQLRSVALEDSRLILCR